MNINIKYLPSISVNISKDSCYILFIERKSKKLLDLIDGIVNA